MASRHNRGRKTRKSTSPQASSPEALPSTTPIETQAESLTPSPAAPAEPTASGRFFTQCPICKTTYKITLAQLRNGRGEARCLQCQTPFNVLSAISDSPAGAFSKSTAPSALPLLGNLDAVYSPAALAQVTEQKTVQVAPLFSGNEDLADNHRRFLPHPHTLGWSFGVLALTGLLILQIARFDGDVLVQSNRWRPWFETACQHLNCRLPNYHAPQDIQIIDHSLQPAPEGIDGYELTLLIANQAPFPQGFPQLALKLEDNNGSTAAARTFQPAEYLPKGSTTQMDVGAPHEIHLLLAKPQKQVGGFSFDLF